MNPSNPPSSVYDSEDPTIHDPDDLVYFDRLGSDGLPIAGHWKTSAETGAYFVPYVRPRDAWSKKKPKMKPEEKIEAKNLKPKEPKNKNLPKKKKPLPGSKNKQGVPRLGNCAGGSSALIGSEEIGGGTGINVADPPTVSTADGAGSSAGLPTSNILTVRNTQIPDVDESNSSLEAPAESGITPAQEVPPATAAACTGAGKKPKGGDDDTSDEDTSDESSESETHNETHNGHGRTSTREPTSNSVVTPQQANWKKNVFAGLAGVTCSGAALYAVVVTHCQEGGRESHDKPDSGNLPDDSGKGPDAQSHMRVNSPRRGNLRGSSGGGPSASNNNQQNGPQQQNVDMSQLNNDQQNGPLQQNGAASQLNNDQQNGPQQQNVDMSPRGYPEHPREELRIFVDYTPLRDVVTRVLPGISTRSLNELYYLSQSAGDNGANMFLLVACTAIKKYNANIMTTVPGERRYGIGFPGDSRSDTILSPLTLFRVLDEITPNQNLYHNRVDDDWVVNELFRDYSSVEEKLHKIREESLTELNQYKEFFQKLVKNHITYTQNNLSSEIAKISERMDTVFVEELDLRERDYVEDGFDENEIGQLKQWRRSSAVNDHDSFKFYYKNLWDKLLVKTGTAETAELVRIGQKVSEWVAHYHTIPPPELPRADRHRTTRPSGQYNPVDTE